MPYTVHGGKSFSPVSTAGAIVSTGFPDLSNTWTLFVQKSAAYSLPSGPIDRKAGPQLSPAVKRPIPVPNPPKDRRSFPDGERHNTAPDLPSFLRADA